MATEDKEQSNQKSTSSKELGNALQNAKTGDLLHTKPADMTLDQAEEYLKINSQYDVSHGWYWQNYNSVKSKYQTLKNEADRLEYDRLQAEYARMAAEAVAKQQPYQQPAGTAAEQYQNSTSDTTRKQMLRRGLLSLTRFGSGSKSNSVSGLATKLGG